MTSHRTILTSSCLIILSASLLAQTAIDQFERGNSFYREGKFDLAVASYESILQQGLASPAVYFNLGNSYYRMGRTSATILAYERAIRLQPNDPDIRHNLDLVNLKTLDRIEPLPELFFVQWLRSLSAIVPLRTTTWLFAVCWSFLFGSIALLYLFNSFPVRRFFRGLAVLSLVALLPLAFLLVMQVADSQNRNDAIVVASIVTAKTSPDTQSLDAFVAHEGLKVRLNDAVGEWVKIILPDGKVGWIRLQDCERI